MNDEQRILHQIKEMQALAEEMGLEAVLAGLEKVLDSYAEDLRSLVDMHDAPSMSLDIKPGTEKFNA